MNSDAAAEAQLAKLLEKGLSRRCNWARWRKFESRSRHKVVGKIIVTPSLGKPWIKVRALLKLMEKLFDLRLDIMVILRQHNFWWNPGRLWHFYCYLWRKLYNWCIIIFDSSIVSFVPCIVMCGSSYAISDTSEVVWYNSFVICQAEIFVTLSSL